MGNPKKHKPTKTKRKPKQSLPSTPQHKLDEKISLLEQKQIEEDIQEHSSIEQNSHLPISNPNGNIVSKFKEDDLSGQQYSVLLNQDMNLCVNQNNVNDSLKSSSCIQSSMNLDKDIEDTHSDSASDIHYFNKVSKSLFLKEAQQEGITNNNEIFEVPHLYIRNSDYATKLGSKYQAIIPEVKFSEYKACNHLERLIQTQKVWGSEWLENRETIIQKCTGILKKWFGYRRNEEQCIQHLLLIGLDYSKYEEFLEENQELLYQFYQEQDSKTIKKKIKKRTIYSK